MPLQLSQANFGLVGQNLPTFTPAQGGVLGAGATMSADIGYKNALAKQAASASQMAAIQSAVAKQGLTNDVISSAKDEGTYQQALKSLNKLGVDTSDVPANYDAKFVGSKQMQSSHYLDLMKAQAEIQMTQLQRDMQANDVNIKAMTSGLQAPYQTGVQSPAAQQLASMTSPNPQSPQMTAPIGAPQAQGQMIQGQGQPSVGMTSSPTSQTLSQPPSNLITQSQPNNLPKLLAESSTGGQEEAKNMAEMEKTYQDSAVGARNQLADIAVARDAVNKANQGGVLQGEVGTGPLAGHLTQYSEAGQQLTKAAANMQLNTLMGLRGIGNRVMNAEFSVLGSANPNVMTKESINNRILNEREAQNKTIILENQALQQLKGMGINNGSQARSILEDVYRLVSPVNKKTGEVNPQALDNYNQAFQDYVSGRTFSPQNLKANADKLGISVDAFKSKLKSQGFNIQ